MIEQHHADHQDEADRECHRAEGSGATLIAGAREPPMSVNRKPDLPGNQTAGISPDNCLNKQAVT